MGLKSVVHHIRHTRPQWYNDYHKWEYHDLLHWTTFVVSSVIIVLGFVNVVYQVSQNAPVQKAHAATTTLTQDVTAGSLTIANTGDQSLSSTAVSTSDQNTTGSLGTITVVDNTGTGNGWTATGTSSHFYKVNTAVKTSGSNNTVTTDGSSTFSHATGGTYTITIASGGVSGVATFDVSGLESASSQTTGTGVAIGTYGVTATFASATYVTGDAWTIRVDVIPVTDLQITPGSVTGNSGSDTTNVTSGSQHTYTTTSDPETLITAPAGYGLGSYSVTPSLQLTVPKNSYANTYTATVTETVS